jgi:hypothetical protein
METADGKMKAELRSGITAPFNKGLNEALQFSAQMPFHIENSVSPVQLLGILKGESGTPGLPAAISAIKDDNNLIAVATSNMPRGQFKLIRFSLATPAAPGAITQEIDIPKGKKWEIVCWNAVRFGGTMTTNQANFRILYSPLADNVTMYKGTTLATEYVTNPNFILDENFKISLYFYVNVADPVSVIYNKLLIREITI